MALKKKIKRSIDPDILFLEPSEMIVTKELREVVAMGLRDIHYTIGPFITLVDGPCFSFHWEERPGLISGQIQDADTIAISRTDRIDPGKTAAICTTLNLMDKDVLLLDPQNPGPIRELARQIILSEKQEP